jgi:hypothetical protein
MEWNGMEWNRVKESKRVRLELSEHESNTNDLLSDD